MAQAALSSVPSRHPQFATDGYVRSADGTRIHYSVVGEGRTTLVCCDGLGCDGYIWRYVREEFAHDYRIVHLHYRAHGSSEMPADPSHIGIRYLCDDVLAVMNALQVEQAILLGHSLGTQVILEFHRLHPERVIGLVPICGSYGRLVDTFRDSRVAKYAFPYVRRAVHRFHGVVQRAWGVLDTEIAYEIAIRGEVNGELVRREDFRPYLSHLAKFDVRAFFDLAADAGEHDALDHLSSIDVPTLIVAAQKDAFTPAWLSSVMHERIAGSELLSIPAATHTAPIEMPELLTLRLRRFLEERFGKPAA